MNKAVDSVGHELNKAGKWADGAVKDVGHEFNKAGNFINNDVKDFFEKDVKTFIEDDVWDATKVVANTGLVPGGEIVNILDEAFKPVVEPVVIFDPTTGGPDP